MCLLQPPGDPKRDKSVPSWVDIQADPRLCWSQRFYCKFFSSAGSFLLSHELNQIPLYTYLWDIIQICELYGNVQTFTDYMTKHFISANYFFTLSIWLSFCTREICTRACCFHSNLLNFVLLTNGFACQMKSQKIICLGVWTHFHERQLPKLFCLLSEKEPSLKASNLLPLHHSTPPPRLGDFFSSFLFFF